VELLNTVGKLKKYKLSWFYSTENQAGILQWGLLSSTRTKTIADMKRKYKLIHKSLVP